MNVRKYLRCEVCGLSISAGCSSPIMVVLLAARAVLKEPPRCQQCWIAEVAMKENDRVIERLTREKKEAEDRGELQ